MSAVDIARRAGASRWSLAAVLLALAAPAARPGPLRAQSSSTPVASARPSPVPVRLAGMAIPAQPEADPDLRAAGAQTVAAGTEVGPVAGPDALPTSVSSAIARFAETPAGREATLAVAASAPATPPGAPGGALVSSTDPADQPPALAPIDPRPLPPADPARGSSGEKNPLFRRPQLPEAPFAPGDRRFPINLAAALRLSDARPLIVAAAQAGAWVAEAELTRAKLLWVPSFNLAADYIRHDGGGPDFNKGVMTSPSVNFLYAGGSFLQSVNLSDVIFAPLQARQRLDARHYDIQAAKNDALLQTTDAYFNVHQARGEYTGHLYTIGRGRELVRTIEDLSRDLTTRLEVTRARNLLADLEQRATLSRQRWQVESANLTQVLRLDPRAVVEPLELDHAQVTLIDPARTLDDLMPVALANRPELGSRSATVREAEYAVRREKNRPLLPLLQLNGFQSAGNGLIQGGIFGLGPNSSLNQFVGRSDVNFAVTWQLEGLGFGNLARIKGARGQQSRTVIDLRQQQDAVAADITRALARVQSASVRVLKADRAVREGLITFNGQIEGLGQTKRFGDVLVPIFRPQETIYSLDLLNIAFVEYFDTVGEYNRAQFDLFHALGYPARELAEFRTPGGAAPVDLDRPSYLPKVGNGPPPARR